MIISHDQQFIFIHIHKTAGDSITSSLQPYLGRTDFLIKSDFQMWLQKRRPSPPDVTVGPLRKHSSALVIRQNVSREIWSSYYKFAFVRHPVDRTFSLYHYAQRKAEERRKVLPRNAWYLTPMGKTTDPLKWPSVRAVLETDSFSEFIRHPAMVREPGMRPQSHFLCDENDQLIVDFVGRFERLQDDFITVRTRLGLPDTRVEWNNASDNSSSKSKQLSVDDRAFLSNRFAEDLDRFGYEM